MAAVLLRATRARLEIASPGQSRLRRKGLTRRVYDALNRFAQAERISKRKRRRSSSRTGVFRQTYQAYLESLGWRWTSTMSIGSGCKIHLRSSEIPRGPLVVKVSRHLTAVIDGVLYDTHDCSRGGGVCTATFRGRS